MLDVSYKLDLTKRRLTPAEFTSLRAALKKYSTRQSELLNFVPETAEHIALGEHRKAIQILRENLAQHPADAMAHARFSRVLITAGMGGAAIREARKATELDPASAAAWQALAWAYQHDVFGRRMQGDWNYSESEKALRKAAELDPDDVVARTDLAILLEHNRQGWRYAKDARLEDAIAVYREILKSPRGSAIAQNLVIALLRAGKLDEVKEEMKKYNLQKTELLDVVRAIQEGPAQVVISAQSQQPEVRQRAAYLASVGATLVALRKYEQATVIMRAAARAGSAADLQARAEIFSKVKNWEEALLKPGDPAYPLQRLLLEATRQNLTREAIEPLLSKRIPIANWDMGDGDVLASARYDMRTAGMTEESMLDMIVSVPEFSSEGDESRGYRIRALMAGAGVMPPMFTVKEDGGYRLIAAGQEGLEGVGKLVLELVDRKAIKDAPWWLDKMVEAADARSDGTGRPAVVSLWSGTTEQLRGPAAIRIAVASLIASSSRDDASIEMLQQARAKAPTPMERAQVDKAVCEGLAKARRWDDLVVAARRLGAVKTFSEESFRYLVKGLAGAGKWKDLETEALKRAADNNTNVAAMRAVVTAKIRLGDHAAAMDWIKKITASDAAGDEEQEFAAWSVMAAGKADAQSLTALQKSRDKSHKPSYRYASAMMQAVLNMPEDARQSLMQGIVREDYKGLSAAAWAAYGKICDQYGFPEDASEAYGRARSIGAKNEEAAAQVLPLIPSK